MQLLTENSRHRTNVGMVGQRHRPCTNSLPALVQCLVYAGQVAFWYCDEN